MANATYEAQGDSEQFNAAAYANIVGAVISLAVFGGIVTWGAQTVLRDSSGVPVVRALEGPARVAPEDPGGLLVAHQGLTVNEVAGSQVIGSTNDPLQLAPRPINLQAEDQPIQSLFRSVTLRLLRHPRLRCCQNRLWILRRLSSLTRRRRAWPLCLRLARSTEL